MITACANPACNRPFHYLRGGRLYRFDLRSPQFRGTDVGNALSGVKHDRTVVFFWLCRECSAKLSLQFDPGAGLTVIPSARRREARQQGEVVITRESSVVTDQAEPPQLASDRLQF